MTKKNRGLLVSIAAGLIAIVLLVVVLVLHVAGASAATAEETGDHGASQPATSPEPETTPQTMVMPDGSIMDMGDMGSTTDEHASTGSAGSTAETVNHSTGGPIDWQTIGLILALVSACIALATATNEYLRRQIRTGALHEAGAASE